MNPNPRVGSRARILGKTRAEINPLDRGAVILLEALVLLPVITALAT